LEPLPAAGTAEAIALAAQHRLAAAVVDQELGGESGLDLIRQLRQSLPELPIVLLAPAHGSPKRDEALDALVFRVPKPIKPYPLHDALRRALAGVQPPSVGGAATSTEPKLADSIPLAILLVEDNPVNQKVALGYLSRLGYQADAAANGLEAIAAVRLRKYDLIFMDLQMPEMDGMAATREIRASLPPESQPVILALTANAMPGDRERCMEAGMNDHLPKPVKGDAVESAILQYFGGKTKDS
jgi:CheY-like chemotaxis protein